MNVANYDLTAHDVKVGQMWRLEVAQNADRHNAVVAEVLPDGHVRMFGADEPITLGTLLAHWRLVGP